MYLTWLNNAYAMENDIIKTLQGQIDDAEDFPDMQEKIKMHLKQTEGHAEKVKNIIERMDEDVNAVKSGMASMMGMMKGASMGMMHDKVIKNALADYATEHMEIASYKALIETAKVVGDNESIPVFESILKEEEEMAQILEKEMPMVLKQFLDTHDDE